MYIYSTSSSDQKFNLFHKLEKGDVPKIAGFVVIKGKANVANKNLITESGVVTKITDKEFDMLGKVEAFKKMLKSGFMTHDAKRLEAGDVAKERLEAKDAAAPLGIKDAEASGVSVHKDGETVI
jgi:hypothetical protein